MNSKRIISLVVAVIGLFLVGYGLYSKNHIAKAKHEIHQISQSRNPVMKSMGKDMETKVGKYDAETKWCIFGGGFLVILGGGAAYFFHKKHRR